MRRAMKASLEPMRQAAEDAAPRSSIETDKHLADAIVIGTRLSRRQRKEARESPSFSALYMGPDHRRAHAIPQEFGTYRHPAHPYMRPAWEAESRPTLERLKGLLWDEIDKAAKRAARKAARLAAKVKAGK